MSCRSSSTREVAAEQRLHAEQRQQLARHLAAAAPAASLPSSRRLNWLDAQNAIPSNDWFDCVEVAKVGQRSSRRDQPIGVA